MFVRGRGWKKKRNSYRKVSNPPFNDCRSYAHGASLNGGLLVLRFALRSSLEHFSFRVSCVYLFQLSNVSLFILLCLTGVFRLLHLDGRTRNLIH